MLVSSYNPENNSRAVRQFTKEKGTWVCDQLIDNDVSEYEYCATYARNLRQVLKNSATQGMRKFGCHQIGQLPDQVRRKIDLDYLFGPKSLRETMNIGQYTARRLNTDLKMFRCVPWKAAEDYHTHRNRGNPQLKRIADSMKVTIGGERITMDTAFKRIHEPELTPRVIHLGRGIGRYNNDQIRVDSSSPVTDNVL